MRYFLSVLMILIFSLIAGAFFRTGICKTERQPVVAFTFDDGPRPHFLEKLLPFLEKEKIPATFFVIGQSAEQFSEFLKKETLKGHEVENHTYSHPILTDLSLANAIGNVKRGADVIEKITGIKPKFLRPPHFAINSRLIPEFQKIDCRTLIHGRNSIGSLDWEYTEAEKVVEQVCGEAKKRGDLDYVIVFHENTVTLKALPGIIEFFRARNYKFVRLDDLVKIEPKADI